MRVVVIEDVANIIGKVLSKACKNSLVLLFSFIYFNWGFSVVT